MVLSAGDLPWLPFSKGISTLLRTAGYKKSQARRQEAQDTRPNVVLSKVFLGLVANPKKINFAGMTFCMTLN